MITLLFIAIITYFIYYWYNTVIRINRGLSWLPAVPGVPFLGNILDFTSPTETINTFTRYVSKYGRLVRIQLANQPSILTADYKFTEFILKSNKHITKSKNYDPLTGWIGMGLLTSTGSKWKARRHAITPTFHFKILEQFLDDFEKVGNITIKKLKNEVGKDSTDVYPYLNLCALDNVCETAMGVSINAQENNDSSYVRAVEELCKLTMDKNFSAFKSSILYRFTSDYCKEKKYLRILHDQTNSVIDTRKKALENKKIESQIDEDTGAKKKIAFLDLMLQAKMNGEPLPHEGIREEVDTFMFGGHDTTSTGMSFALHCLAENPEAQQLAFEEQKSIFGNERDRKTTWQDVQDMKYLELVIKETMRLFPPALMIGREIMEDDFYDNNPLPKGTTITVFIYGIHRNEEYFPNPETFDPFRFENSNIPPYAYIPFSAGPRNCIGQKYAMVEMKMTLAKIIRNFVIAPTTPKHIPVLRDEQVLKSDNGIKLKLTTRNWD